MQGREVYPSTRPGGGHGCEKSELAEEAQRATMTYSEKSYSETRDMVELGRTQPVPKKKPLKLSIRIGLGYVNRV